MRRKIALMLCTVMCISVMACGGEEPVTSPAVDTPAGQEETPADTPAIQEETPVDVPEQEVEEDIPEDFGEEEMFGDVDVDASGITMDDMVPYEIAVDLPLEETDYTGNIQYLTMSDFSINGLTVLFPSTQYITMQSPRETRIDTDDAAFWISARVESYDPRTNITAGDWYEYGIYKVNVRNEDRNAGTELENIHGMAYSVFIFDTELNNRLVIQVAGELASDEGIAVLDQYEEAFVSDILAQVEARAN